MSEEAPVATADHPVGRRDGQLRDLLRAAHPAQAVLTAAVLGVAALVDGRGFREFLSVVGAVLVVQLIAGLSNDLADQEHDYRGEVPHKPIASGRLPAGNASYAILVLLLLAIPLALQNGTLAAAALLGSLPVIWISNRWLHRTVFSWLPWMVTFALYPFFLSYGGWAAGVHGGPPAWPVVVAAAALGFCVHFLTTLPDLVSDHKTGARNLPLRIALRIGAPRLLLVTVLLTLLTVAGLIVALATVGLRA